MMTSTGWQVLDHPVKRLVEAPVVRLAVAAVPRSLARRPPLPEHGIPQGADEGPAAGGDGRAVAPCILLKCSLEIGSELDLPDATKLPRELGTRCRLHARHG